MLRAIKKLIEQIEMCDFKDEIGHPLKNNVAYNNLKSLFETIDNGEYRELSPRENEAIRLLNNFLNDCKKTKPRYDLTDKTHQFILNIKQDGSFEVDAKINNVF